MAKSSVAAEHERGREIKSQQPNRKQIRKTTKTERMRQDKKERQ
jgi:hypothetical protein